METSIIPINDIGCIDDIAYKNPRFVGMVQVNSNKTATNLKTNAVVEYPTHTVPLNFTKEFCWYLHDRGHSFSGLLLVLARDKIACNDLDCENQTFRTNETTKVIPSLYELPASTSKNGQTLKQKVPHQARI